MENGSALSNTSNNCSPKDFVSPIYFRAGPDDIPALQDKVSNPSDEPELIEAENLKKTLMPVISFSGQCWYLSWQSPDTSRAFTMYRQKHFPGRPIPIYDPEQRFGSLNELLYEEKKTPRTNFFHDRKLTVFIVVTLAPAICMSIYDYIYGK